MIQPTQTLDGNDVTPLPASGVAKNGRDLPPESAPAANGQTLARAARSPARRPKGGAPAGNRNAYRHGLYSPRGPAGSKYIDRAAGQFRRHLEDQTLAVYGEISTLAASLIQTAAEAARAALAELKELQTLADKLDPQQKTAKRQAALKSLDLRDRKVKELGITFAPDVPSDRDPWQEFDEERKLATAEGQTPPDAPSGLQRFSDASPALQPPEPAGTPQRAAGKATNDSIAAATSAAANPVDRKEC